MKRAVKAVLILLISVQTAWATPSKLIRIPSGDVQPFGTFHLGIDNTTTMFLPKKSGGYNLEPVYGISAGIYDLQPLQIEAGIDLREPTDYPATWHIKVALPEGAFNPESPAIFGGGYDLGTKEGENDYNIAYVGAAKTVSFIGRFTFGYFAGNASHLKDTNGTKSNDGIIMGFDRRMPEINERLWFGIDFQGTNSDYGALGVGFTWSFSENASLLLGFIRYNKETPIRKNLVSWQVDFDF
ncbi:MAG: hypothetical protein IEMM0002_1040 [bacterium]|nr:MAG: hypothetical protein IEMM0002_1040 [bacterium]